jgi:hypothetical protein
MLGARLARRVGRLYRAIFVDLAKEAAALVNRLLALRPDLRVTTLDPKPNVGEWIEERFARQLTRLAGTSLAEYVDEGRAEPDAVLIADVLHHIPPAERGHFLGSLRLLLERTPLLRIIVKDVEPGYWRALLGYWSDRYITGDLGVSPISSESLVRLLDEKLGPLRREDTNLFETDKPNYAIAFFR